MSITFDEDGCIFTDGGFITVDVRKTPKGKVYIRSFDFTPTPEAENHYIRMKEASEKYDISMSTLTNWADRSLITTSVRGHRFTLVEESSVALVAGLFVYVKQFCPPLQAIDVVENAFEEELNKGMIDPDTGKRISSVVDTSAQLFPMIENPELIGKEIRLLDAAKKYNVNSATLSRWAQAGIVKVISKDPGYVVLDEASVEIVSTAYNYLRDFFPPQRSASIVRKLLALKKDRQQEEAGKEK